jgi:hypothetical protein
VLNCLIPFVSHLCGFFSKHKSILTALLLSAVLFNAGFAYAITTTTTLTITPATTVNAGTVVTMTAHVSKGTVQRG